MESLSNTFARDRKEPGFWREMWQQARLVWFLFRDPDVPFYLKSLPVAAVMYALWPLDLLPGWPIDDITALLIAGKVFIELSPPEIVARHLKLMREQGQNWEQIEADSGTDISDNLEDAIIIDPDYEIRKDQTE